MDFPAQAHPHPHGGWPGNELEEVLSAALGMGAAASAGARIVEVLGRSFLWVPLPNGGGPGSAAAGPAHHRTRGPGVRPGLQLRGAVPAGRRRPHVVHRRARRGVRPRAPPAGRASRSTRTAWSACRCRRPRSRSSAGPGAPRWTGRRAAAGCGCSSPTGRRTRWTSSPRPPPSSPGPASCCSARRCLASIEGDDPVLFIGVELSLWEGEARTLPLDALGRALGRVPMGMPVNLVLLDVAQDPVGDWMRAQVRPFYQAGH